MLGMKDLDAVDPATGMSTRQKKAIRDSWAIVGVDIKGNGVKFLIKFFAEYPKDRTYFAAFDGMNDEQLMVNVKLRAHATMVMNALSSIVDNLDDPGCLIIFLRKNAQDHHGRSIGVLQYKHLFETFGRFMAESLGPKYPPFTREAWEKALEVVISIIDTELTAIEDT